MSSKAWYQPTKLPRLIAKFSQISKSIANNHATRHEIKKSIEIWTTTCIVTNFGKNRPPKCSTLINPANPQLTGPNSFPYFPRGGPQPKTLPNRPAHHIMGYVSQWGGMDVGGGMLFSAAAIDGLVHQLGGLSLRAECSMVPNHPLSHLYINQQTDQQSNSGNNDKGFRDRQQTNVNNTHSDTRDLRANGNNHDGKAKCPVGMAVVTSPGGRDLQTQYDRIIHTVPPFYNYPPSVTNDLLDHLRFQDDISREEEIRDTKNIWSEQLLRSCYRQSFQLAFPQINNFDNNTTGINLDGIIGNFMSKVASYYLSMQSSQTDGVPSEKRRVAIPLLGAGCRGFPVDVALSVAASESVSWLMGSNGLSVKNELSREYEEVISIRDLDKKSENFMENDGRSEDNMVIAFGLLEDDEAEDLAERIHNSLDKTNNTTF